MKTENIKVANQKLAEALKRKVKFTKHGYERLTERFSGEVSGAYVSAVSEAISLLGVMWTKKKVCVERSEVLVVVARAKRGDGYEVVTAWDPRSER